MAWRLIRARRGQVIALVKPIRKSLLIHEVEYHKWDDNDRFGGGYAAPVTVKNVRIEPKDRYVVDSNSGSVDSATLLIVDGRHSTPIDLQEQSKVIFEGEEYIVQSVNTFYARSKKPHHWEAVLV